jgi:2-C-methyl-D-erythritol 4-phosphate cytidylyltransferase
MAVALIVAAGRGERLGFGRPKALVMLAGRPMLDWSIAALGAVDGVQRIVVALPAEDVGSAALPHGVLAVAGGTVRSESVRLALDAAGPGDPVIVHDAARPLAQADLFLRALAELESSGADAAIAAAPVSDTIKEVGADGATVARTLDRRRLWAVQTPQVFRRATLERVFTEASDELLAAATDDAWLIERAGGAVRIVASTPENLKVTTLNDLHVAELLLSERGSS